MLASLSASSNLNTNKTGGVTCHNKACSHTVDIEARQSLFKCGNCHRALYCSKDCQKAAWKTHKPRCEQIKQSSNMPSFSSLAQYRESREEAFFGWGKSSERLEERSVDGDDPETLQMKDFAKSLDVGHCVEYAMEKYCNLGVKGTLVFDIDRPTGICSEARFGIFEFWNMPGCQATGCRTLQETVRDHDPETTVCVLYYKLAEDLETAIIWCTTFKFGPLGPQVLRLRVRQTKMKVAEAGEGSELYSIKTSKDPALRARMIWTRQ